MAMAKRKVLSRHAAAIPASDVADPTADPAARLVTSAHLVSPRSPETSEFEFALTMASNAFGRWVVRCMAAAGLPDLTTLDVLVLHHVHHRGRPKKTADICFILNVEDTHTVTYALKKLLGLGLIAGRKEGKEVFYTTTDAGQRCAERYRQVRESCLIGAIAGGDATAEEIGRLARLLRTFSGLYDQAARAAASL
jgi:predicted MarR family transcription regulator